MNQSLQNKLEAFLKKAFAPFGTRPDVEFEEGPGKLVIKISLDPRAAEIMLRGLDAVLAWQQILRAVAAPLTSDKITVDINNFLSVQNVELKELAENSAKKVEQSKKPLKLAPMTAFERRIIHMVVSENHPELATESVGVPPRRCVIIKPKE